MNQMEDAFSKAIKKRGEAGPSLNIKISLEKEGDKQSEGLAPAALEPESPHKDEAQDEALIDKKLSEKLGDAVVENEMAEESQEEGEPGDDPEMMALLDERAAAIPTREPRTLSERAAAEYAEKKKVKKV